jgi:ribosome-associated heat shock protein Hsp15
MSAAAIDNGKVMLGGQRAKASRAVKVGDMISVRKGIHEYEIEVLALSDKRGSAAVAQGLYRETEDSVRQREERSQTMKAEAASAPSHEGKGRPTKKDRRRLTKIKRY